MKQFIGKLMGFSIPFILWLVIVAFVDPYNYINRKTSKVIDPLKKDISFELNFALYELLEYKYEPNQSIILGDSRARLLRSKMLNKYSERSFSNLAYSGGSINEIVKTFWLVANEQKLNDVYIGLNFDLYNKYNQMDRVTEAESIMKNFFSYAFSTYSFKATFLILKSVITGHKVTLGRPKTSKEIFWKHQLNVSAKKYYSKYKYPSEYYNELRKISKYCNTNNINLVFFIPPTHTDLQYKVKEYHLQDQETKFKNDLMTLGDLYDFNYPSNLTVNKNNFIDPYHSNEIVCEMVIRELFVKNARKYAKYSMCTTYNKIKHVQTLTAINFSDY